MSRKLWALNALLLALVAVCGWQIHSRWKQHVAAQSKFFSQPVKPDAAPVVVLPQQPPPVSPSSFIAIANELLFSRDRNPTVVIEKAEEKKMPALPRYYGSMNFGSGPRVLLAVESGKEQKAFQLGDTVGDFKLLAISSSDVVFEWDGKKVPAKLKDLLDLAPVADASAPVTTTAKPSQAAQVKTMEATTIQDTNKPGRELSGGQYRGCQPSDKSPSGTVMDGYRKVVSKTLFGETCRWEKVQ